MKRISISIVGWSAVVLALLTGLSPAWAAKKPSASDLLKNSDRARGGLLKGVEWQVDLISTEGGSRSERSFEVKAKGDDALAEGTAPARDKGSIFLFNNRDMWFVEPGLRKPIAISARQRLSGQAANGDIATTRYSRDYTASIAGEKKIKGQKVYVLELKAKDKKSTYDRIRYYISEKTGLAVRAEFLTLQGSVFKVADFEYGNSIQGYPFVSKMDIVDAKFPTNRSELIYKNPSERSFPSSIFNINNVSR